MKYHLKHADPDVVSISVEGHEQLNAVDGVFAVDNDALAASLLAHPFNMTHAEDVPNEPVKSTKVEEEDEFAGMNKGELKDWLTERGETWVGKPSREELLSQIRSRVIEDAAKTKAAAETPAE